MQKRPILFKSQTNLNGPGRRVPAIAACVAAGSICYAGAAMGWLSHGDPLSHIVDVFIAGALPGLLLNLLLWLARPGLFDRRIRQQMIGVTLSAPAAVAIVPALMTAF